MFRILTVMAAGLMISLVGLSPALGTAYYVSPTGSDSNDGLSEQAPFLEIQTALNAAVSPGDTVYVMPGLHIPVEFLWPVEPREVRLP